MSDPLFPLFVRPLLGREVQQTKTLTRRQARALTLIEDAVAERGYPPTVREMQVGLGLRSPGSVTYVLRMLEAKGRIRKEPGRPRAIEVIPA